ncbi:MAG: alginate lyase family protein [Verrucomicrobia bacterium]|nr:alginate lyase family protein [Verrucomicrobiota bacterium]
MFKSFQYLLSVVNTLRKIGIRTLRKIGIREIAYVWYYRMSIKSGLRMRFLKPSPFINGQFFEVPSKLTSPLLQERWLEDLHGKAQRLLEGYFEYYRATELFVQSPPRWFSDPFNQSCFAEKRMHWAHPEFGRRSQNSDIKTFWEVSRFSWLTVLTRAYVASHHSAYLETLNAWLSDWISQNPLNIGPNWVCGQEASIRVFHLLLSAYLLQSFERPTETLRLCIEQHCWKISSNIGYGIAQNNNHGLNEAAALYMAGAWLSRVSPVDSPAQRNYRDWEKQGFRWLENRIQKLIFSDGGFCQRSPIYHRLVVDVLNLVRFFQTKLQLADFSPSVTTRIRMAIAWLYFLTEPETGDMPNFSDNDGTLVFPLSSSSLRDFRSTTQLGTALFYGKRAYPQGGPYDEPLEWLGLANELQALEQFKEFPISKHHSGKLEKSGLVILQGKNAWGVISTPTPVFRPAHADALHLDLWAGSKNVLRDLGSYTYHDLDWRDYFSGTGAHNTVEFDGRDQMPRLGKCLYGAWTQMETNSEIVDGDNAVTWSGSYVDFKGARHQRTITVYSHSWRIIDTCSGFRTMATLRWHLAPGLWRLEGNRCIGEHIELIVTCSRPVARLELVPGWEASSYQSKTPIPVLETETGPEKMTFTTEIILKA